MSIELADFLLGFRFYIDALFTYWSGSEECGFFLLQRLLPLNVKGVGILLCGSHILLEWGVGVGLLLGEVGVGFKFIFWKNVTDCGGNKWLRGNYELDLMDRRLEAGIGVGLVQEKMACNWHLQRRLDLCCVFPISSLCDLTFFFFNEKSQVTCKCCETLQGY